MDPLVVRAQYGKIGDALAEVGEGLGRAHRELVDKGRTEIGTLAMKSAEVTMEMELAAVAERQFLEAGQQKPGDADGLGTLAFRSLRLGVGNEQTRFTNKLTVKFQAVVVPPAAQTERTLPTGWPWDKWTVKQLDYVEDVLTRFLKLAPEGRGDNASWTRALERVRSPKSGPVREAVAALRALIEALEGTTAEERTENPDGVALVTEIEGIVRTLRGDLDLATAISMFLKVRALHAYFRGVLTGVQGAG